MAKQPIDPLEDPPQPEEEDSPPLPSWLRNTQVFHGALTTALVFICVQVYAFTTFFNKTYVEALVRALRVPAKTLAYQVAASSPEDNYELRAQVRDTCGDGIDTTKMKEAATAFAASIPRAEQTVMPSMVTGSMIGLAFAVLWYITYLKGRIDVGSAQAIFNGAAICSMFTMAEIYLWLGVNTAKVQTKVTESIRAGAKHILEKNTEWCSLIGPAAVAQQGRAGWVRAYNDARRTEGVIVDTRQSLWAPAAGIVFGCLAGALGIKDDRVEWWSLDAFGKEVVLTTILVGAVQLRFLDYSTNYTYYGSKKEDMEDIVTRAVCEGVGGPGQRPYGDMPPTLTQALRASDAEIPYTSGLRTLATVYASVWALLLVVRVSRTSLASTLADIGRGALVALAGWLTEAYFYQFVVAPTVFATWSMIEAEMTTSAMTVCPADSLTTATSTAARTGLVSKARRAAEARDFKL